jgi:hypothetical protein
VGVNGCGEALEGEAYPDADNQIGLFRANVLHMPLHIQPCAGAGLAVMEQGGCWNQNEQDEQ